MQAPEIKYAWRMFFILPFFFILIYIKNRFFSKIVNFSHNFFLGTFLIILLLFFSKSLRFFKIEDFLSAQGRQHDFSKIQKIEIFNNMEIYYNFWKCADYALACVYFPKDKYNINQRYSCAFFENDLFLK
jgi:Mn2+/Fe2+ NRAMP family transporter